MDDNIHIVTSWNDFSDIVFKDCWNDKIQRHRTNTVFRGLSNSSFDLKPSLNRVCQKNLHLEKSLIRNFKKYASLEIRDPNNFWEIISLAQHHGLPTRLLDWTFSPYIAAHFATEDLSSYDVDGAIWCVDFEKCHKDLPKKLLAALNTTDAYCFSTDILNRAVSDFETLGKMDKESFVLFFEPPSIDNRIINQYALFSVMSDSAILITEWLSRHTDVFKKIIIPAWLKLEIRDKLDEININDRIIYPGLDGLCKWLARHYTPTECIIK